MERAFAALNSTAGTAQHQMIQQFCRRAALRMHNAFATHFCEITKQQDRALAQTALNAKVNGTNDARRAANLTQLLEVTTTITTNLQRTNVGTLPATGTLNQTVGELTVGELLSNKVLKPVKHCLRCKARKLADMKTKTCLMHVMHISQAEIVRCPPIFCKTQSHSGTG